MASEEFSVHFSRKSNDNSALVIYHNYTLIGVFFKFLLMFGFYIRKSIKQGQDCMYKLTRIQCMFCQEHIINTVLYFCNIVCNAKIIAEKKTVNNYN